MSRITHLNVNKGHLRDIYTTLVRTCKGRFDVFKKSPGNVVGFETFVSPNYHQTLCF